MDKKHTDLIKSIEEITGNETALAVYSTALSQFLHIRKSWSRDFPKDGSFPVWDELTTDTRVYYFEKALMTNHPKIFQKFNWSEYEEIEETIRKINLKVNEMFVTEN